MTLTKDDIIAKIDLPAALGLLTRLPVPVDMQAATARGARAAWAFPVAGLFVGGVAACVTAVALWLGLLHGPAAALFLAVQIIITGAMHEDGLADTADGLWGGWTRERRLEIMKDSQIGTYGTLALGLSILARWSALVLIVPHGLWLAALTVPAMARVPMVVLMGLMPNARETGLSQSVGRPPAATMWVAIGVGLVVAVLLHGAVGLLLVLMCVLCGLTCGWIARAKIGGQTGDILGATQQITEIALWCTLAAMLA